MMTHDQATDAVMQMLGAAAVGQAEEAASLLQQVGLDSDGPRMFGVCCALAEGGAQMLKRLFSPREFGPAQYGLLNLGAGDETDDPPNWWAARFLIAWANQDAEQCHALFGAALADGPEFFVEAACALLAASAGLIRTALDEKHRSTS